VAGDDFFPVYSVTVPRASPELALQQIPDRVAAVIAQFLDPTNPYETLESPPRVLAAYREYRRAYEIEAQGGTEEEAIGHLLRASEMDSLYLTPLFDVLDRLRVAGRGEERDSVLGVLESRRHLMTPLEILYFDWLRLDPHEDSELALLKVREIAEIHPTAMAYNHGLDALNMNCLEEAASALERWEKPGGGFLDEYVAFHPLYFNVYAKVLHLLGRHQKELEVVMEAQRRFPSERYFRDGEMEARGALGDMEGLEPLIDRDRSGGVFLLFRIFTTTDELRAHGHPEEARAILEEEVSRFETNPHYSDPDTLRPARRPNNRAHVLHRLGREEEAHALWEEVFSYAPSNAEVMGLLGVTAAHTGDTAQAREMLDRVSRISDPHALARAAQYRAWIATALGEYDQAVQFLRELPPLNGSRGLYLHRDINLEPLRDDPAFVEFMRSKG
jgi:tetratricopeptide (TPR) repeat protein